MGKPGNGNKNEAEQMKHSMKNHEKYEKQNQEK